MNDRSQKFLGVLGLLAFSSLVLGASSTTGVQNPASSKNKVSISSVVNPASQKTFKPVQRTPSNQPFYLLGEYTGSQVSDQTPGMKLTAYKAADMSTGMVGWSLDFGRNTPPKKGRTVGKHQIFLLLDQYKALFETAQSVEIPEWQVEGVRFSAHSEVNGNMRVVSFTSFRRGAFSKTHEEEVVFRLLNGELNEVSLTQYFRSAWAPFGSMQEYFSETMYSLARLNEGLELRDDQGVLGRVVGENEIRQAADNPDADHFKKLLAARAILVQPSSP